jgi:hypothetical protein
LANSFVEYKVAREKLGDTSDEHPFVQFGGHGRSNVPLKEIIGTILADLPMVSDLPTSCPVLINVTEL